LLWPSDGIKRAFVFASVNSSDINVNIFPHLAVFSAHA
jgi:hypothetical protein